MKECTQCKAILKDDATFCNFCGTKQETPTTPVNIAQPAAQPSSHAKYTASSLGATNNSMSISQIIMGIVTALLGAISFFIVLLAGLDLSEIRSKAGNSIAEAFYQGIGSVMIGLALLILLVTVYCVYSIFSKKTSKK